LKIEIAGDENQLSTLEAEMNGLKDSMTAIDRQYPSHVAPEPTYSRYNAMVATYNADMATYNRIVEQHNAAVGESDAVTWPDMKPIARPAGAADGAWPVVQPDGTVTFSAPDRRSLLATDGSIYWTFPLKTPAEYAGLLQSPFAGRSVVTWSTTPSAGNSATRNYLGVLDGMALTAVYNQARYLYTSVWLARNALISSVDASPPSRMTRRGHMRITMVSC
jgi:hypothetical protein